MSRKRPPRPVHVAGTHKGEEMADKYGREHGRDEEASKDYRSARDSTSINAKACDPIDPRMPHIPPA